MAGAASRGGPRPEPPRLLSCRARRQGPAAREILRYVTSEPSRYVEGHTETTADGLDWRVVSIGDDTLTWACSDGHFYPLGTGPELPPDERHLFGLSLAYLVHPARLEDSPG